MRDLHGIQNRFADALLVKSDQIRYAKRLVHATVANLIDHQVFAQPAADHGYDIVRGQRLDRLLVNDGRMDWRVDRVALEVRMVKLRSVRWMHFDGRCVPMRIRRETAVVDPVVIDASVLRVADGPASDRADRSTDQSAGGFVVPFVTDRDSDSGTGQSAQQGSATSVGSRLRGRGLHCDGYQNNKKCDSRKHECCQGIEG